MDAKAKRFDRTAEDTGNIVSMEHVNVQIPDQRLATLFYVEGLGFTRDPYMHVTDRNMWVNLGRNQFHLPNVRPTQVFRAVIGLVVPSLDGVRTRFKRAGPQLEGTKFTYTEERETLLLTCPWGNRMRVHQAGVPFTSLRLGIPYVDFPVKRGAAGGIARFYREVIKAPARVDTSGATPAAHAKVGIGQELIFTETDQPITPYDGHHLAVYVTDFGGPHAWLNARGLVSEESDQYQYRFEQIVDPATNEALFEIQHEVRSLTHPMYTRHLNLVNRNPEQSPMAYMPGRDFYVA